ncbi:hypothetical protein ACOSQ3_023228 [Xanthoceras sorbifolium]
MCKPTLKNGVASIPTWSRSRSTHDLFICSYSQPSNNNSQLGANHHSSPFRYQSDDEDAVFTWNPAPQSVTDDGENYVLGGKVATTVVLIGWLGAKTKHLKSYVKWYNSRGVNAITFVVEASELLTYEVGHSLDKRMSRLGDKLASWVLSSSSEINTETEDHSTTRQHCLVFHTFSNTGWLVYGAILDDLQSRHDLMVTDNIKGCVVDSGGGDPSNPQVWAAGFAAALAQKRGGSSANPRIKTTKIYGAESDHQVIAPKKEPADQMDKIILQFVFEKFFSILLNLPRLNQKLKRTTSVLKEKQAFPQLYLYSTGDKVIPSKSVEMFMEEQRKMGRKVISFNFGSSSHLGHYWNFRSKYSSYLRNFLKQCFDTERNTSDES